MINQTISHYRITGQLGSGGMGVVYEAEDLTLGRKVALKFLPPKLASDRSSLDRFLLEARTASALNHPNICTIYAVENASEGNAEPQSFIAMELLEGQNLAEKLVSGLMPTDRLMDIGIQLADALDAAHAKGIIHRDIKPANIFLTSRGQVKVLDFGLAKLAPQHPETETIGTTQDSPAHLTSPGATVGTIAYMSPEQARGEALDTRTDLFSLGTVLYQMVTGKVPFDGPTSAVVFHGILQLDPTPVQQLNPNLPPRLQEIIEKLLEKDRDLRYQSAADLRGDLKRLKRDSESGRKTASASSASGSTVPPAIEPLPSVMTRPASSSAVIAAAGRHKAGVGLGIVLGVIVLAAAGYGIYAALSRGQALPFQNISVTKVTDTGDMAMVALSPDGKYILSLVQENGLTSLSLRNVPTNSITQVEPPADVHYNGLRFAPDGNYFYFVRSDPGNDELKYLYRAPLLGGTPERLASDVDSNITLSPDGRRAAFMRYNNPEPGKYQLIVRSVENGEEKILASGRDSLFAPAWSPDGKNLIGVTLQAANSLTSLVLIDANSGQRKIFFNSPDALDHPTWMPDGGGLLVFVRNQATHFAAQQIEFISYPEGKVTPVTRDTNSYSDLSVDSTGQVLATVLSAGRWNLTIAGATGSADPRTVAPANMFTNFTWLHDGRILYDKDNSLHRLTPDSGDQEAIAIEPGMIVGDPWECPDHQHFVLLMGRAETNVWRADDSGGNFKQLTTGRFDNYPVCSADGHWVYYLDVQGTLMKVPLEGGNSQKVSDLQVAGWFGLSPDGATSAFSVIDHAAGHVERIALVDTMTGQTRQMIPFQRPRTTNMLQFSRDGKSLVYVVRENGIDNLWQQPLDGSAGKMLTSFKAEHIWDYHWSPDGTKLALVQGHTDSDVVLMRNQRQ